VKRVDFALRGFLTENNKFREVFFLKVSVVIPCYNEKDHILSILEKIEAVKLDKEVVIIDDNSTDGTQDILKKISPDKAKVYFHEVNKGKGAAIKTALQYVKGDVVIIQDADLEYDPNDYYELLKPIQEGKAEVVYGSRILHEGFKVSYFRYYLGGRVLSWLTNLLYNAHITDEPTGYKVFTTNVLKDIGLKSTGFEFCPEVTAKVRKKGYEIHEVPISYYPRSLEEGKKIGWRDGVEAIWTLLKYRFVD
jgi:dolichol-phosphate mannosyltransferase